MPEPPTARAVAGVLLAGGRARRMGGGDKCLRLLGGKTLLTRTIERLDPQVDGLVLSANGDPARFTTHGLPVIADTIPDFAGPLAGILSAMEWLGHHRPNISHVLSAPTDTPFLPRDLVSRLCLALQAETAVLACAASGGRRHPVVGLWPVALAGDLRRAMRDEDIRKIDLWTGRYPLAAVDWTVEPVDPFFNVNRAGDLEAAAALLDRSP